MIHPLDLYSCVLAFQGCTVIVRINSRTFHHSAKELLIASHFRFPPKPQLWASMVSFNLPGYLVFPVIGASPVMRVLKPL